MTLFLDSSVLLAACGSRKGASREIFRRASKQSWRLLTIPYVLEEVARNLNRLPPAASAGLGTFATTTHDRRQRVNAGSSCHFYSGKRSAHPFQCTRMVGCAAHLGFKGFRRPAGQRVLRIASVEAGCLLGTRTCDEPLAVKDFSFPSNEDR